MANGKTKIAQPVPQLPVEDVEKAQAYYQRVLGFEIAWTYPDKSIGAVKRDESVIFFAKTKGVIVSNVHWIYSDDVDQTYWEFKENGADIIEDIENKPWDIRQFTIRDPSGHIFYIHHDI